MGYFEYKGYTKEGKNVEGTYEASSEKQAIKSLLEKGIFVDSIEVQKLKKKIGPVERAAIYRELGALLYAGIPLDKAIEMLSNSEKESVSLFLRQILEKIKEGVDFSVAMSTLCHEANGFEIAALSAAERSGKMSEMCIKVSDFLDKAEQIKDKIRSSLIYPSFVLSLGFVVGIAMLGFVVPNTVKMLESSGVALPLISQVIIVVAKAIMWFVAIALIGSSLAYKTLKYLSRTREELSENLDKFLLKLSGAPGRELVNMRFSSIFSVLMGAGTPIVNALELAGSGTGNKWIEKQVKKQVERVRNGETVSAALDKVEVLKKGGVIEWIRIGETGGCLPAMLDVASSRSQRMWEKFLSIRMAMLEPAMLISVGLLVLIIALAVLLPVLGMTRSVGI